MTQRALLPRRSADSHTESREFHSNAGLGFLFASGAPAPHSTVTLRADASAMVDEAGRALGPGLDSGEIEYLRARYRELGRDPTDVELMMFAQVNSEHCRHRIFNASWTIDGIEQDRSLFEMIRHTHACSPGDVLSAYHDNAAVMRGHEASWFVPDRSTGRYAAEPGRLEILMKVETHNHPTAISPFPGAATGSGGEIRDEAATGRGARSKAGVAGFSVSNLLIPGFVQPWEHDMGRPRTHRPPPWKSCSKDRSAPPRSATNSVVPRSAATSVHSRSTPRDSAPPLRLALHACTVTTNPS